MENIYFMNNESVYYSLLPLIVTIECMAFAFTYFALTWHKRTKHSEETLSRVHKSFIGIFLIEFWYWLTNPLLYIFKVLHFTPNKITTLSIFLSFITGLIYATGNFAFAGWMLVISGTLDMLDGRLARETGTATREGAFFDSCSDRYSDSFVLIGIAVYFLSKNYFGGDFTISLSDFIAIVVILFLMLGTASVSYVKARGEAVGITTKSGLMQRPERIMMLSIYSILDPFLRIIQKNYGMNDDYGLIFLLILMTVLINSSAVSRMRDIFRQIRESGGVS